MNSESLISISTIVILFNVGVAIFNVYHTNHKDKQNDIDDEKQKVQEESEHELKRQKEMASINLEMTKQFTKTNTKLETVCSSLNSIQVSLEQQRQDLQRFNDKQVIHDEKINTLFKYKDDHEERIRRLEKNKGE